MNRKLATIIGLQALLIVMLFWVLVFYGKDEYEALNQEEEEQITSENRVENKQGATVITVSKSTQAQSDINTSALKASTHQIGISNYGNVLAIDGLIELRARYLAAKADAQILSASLTQNKSEYHRLLTLNQDDKNVSDKAVASALAESQSNEAKVLAAETHAKNIAESMQQAWGKALTQLATTKSASPLLQNLINHQSALIQITLPFNSQEPTANSQVNITLAEAQFNGTATYLSPAPMSNANMQGKTYFYHIKSNALRAGMKVNVLNLSQAKLAEGVIIPAEAVVWYGGKPWVYRKQGSTQFSRLPINTDAEVANGWFYQGSLQTGNLKANDPIVTSGAQLLLSEEFKSQITNENED